MPSPLEFIFRSLGFNSSARWGYITVLFDEYAESGDTATLLSSLRVVSRVKGVSRIAEISGLSRKGLQKALSENGNPQFGRVNAIMHAMGYRLTAQKLPEPTHPSFKISAIREAFERSLDDR